MASMIPATTNTSVKSSDNIVGHEMNDDEERNKTTTTSTSSMLTTSSSPQFATTKTLWDKIAIEKQRQEHVRTKYLSDDSATPPSTPTAGSRSVSLQSTNLDTPTGSMKGRKSDIISSLASPISTSSSCSRETIDNENKVKTTPVTGNETSTTSGKNTERLTKQIENNNIILLRYHSEEDIEVEEDIKDKEAINTSKSWIRPESSQSVVSALTMNSTGDLMAYSPTKIAKTSSGQRETQFMGDTDCSAILPAPAVLDTTEEQEQVPSTTDKQKAIQVNYLNKQDLDEDNNAATTTIQNVTSESVIVEHSSSLDNMGGSTHTSSSKNQLVWGSRRIIKQEDVKEREWWVYLVTFFMLVAVTAGLSCVVFLVYGAADPQIDYEEDLQSQVVIFSHDPNVFNEPSSAQSLALKWLANADEVQVDPNDSVRVVTRYSLAVLFFATNGASEWWNKLNFLSSDHECEWNNGEKGFFCDPEIGSAMNLLINSNNLRGSLPVELSALSTLKNFNLENNIITGTIPSWKLDLLETLMLKHNRMEGSLPDVLTDMTRLKNLDLSINLLTSSMPQNLNQLSDLETLNLGKNELRGLGSEFSVLTNLRELNLTNSEFMGDLDWLKDLPNLISLDLNDNNFEANLEFEKFSQMTNLETLILSKNKVVGPVPSSLGKLTQLSYINLSDNLLTGRFPWFSFTESKLREVKMSDNLFTGQIPLDIFRFELLEIVNFAGNHLSGSIPLGIGGSSSLKTLQISANSIEGPIPASVGNLELLMFLDLSDNNLNGTLPDTIGNLSSLYYMDVHGNQLSGTVPQGLEDFTNAERIGLQDNDLTGNIDFLCTLESKPIISADCAGTPPKLICSCCDICLQ